MCVCVCVCVKVMLASDCIVQDQRDVKRPRYGNVVRNQGKGGGHDDGGQGGERADAENTSIGPIWGQIEDSGKIDFSKVNHQSSKVPEV